MSNSNSDVPDVVSLLRHNLEQATRCPLRPSQEYYGPSNAQISVFLPQPPPPSSSEGYELNKNDEYKMDNGTIRSEVVKSIIKPLLLTVNEINGIKKFCWD